MLSDTPDPAVSTSTRVKDKHYHSLCLSAPVQKRGANAHARANSLFANVGVNGRRNDPRDLQSQSRDAISGFVRCRLRSYSCRASSVARSISSRKATACIVFGNTR